MLEAAVLKKFIISTNCPTGPREILSNGIGGELVKVGDFKSISKVIINLKKNKQIVNKKINYTYKSLYRFDFKQNLNKYYNLVKSYL